MMKYIAFVLTAWMISAQSFAVVETYQFDNDVQEKRYHHFTTELRCPKCQNQNLNDSNSPIAKDLREQLYKQLKDGRSDTEITAFMVDRYGDFILYRPRLNHETIVLWFGPLGLLLGGIVFVILLVRRHRSAQAKLGVKSDESAAALSEKQQQQIDKLLDGENDK
ncbi:cytochrome c-type biogenesis protein CcmH [Sinobacterium caligoides]|uniref:Cytochrome c-type biogenesis protein n=1 Tax=Sinobacterium caligoides TaxID=933926 RepID=A0A3N2DYV5_9GAMM|nr:cytochrome c-type biogenesis protein [Sinobacterium caligoides]ROS04669.1 cytochrome c-type biogenesis protein CcmH [Sinobacterium caligoides]